MALLEQPFKVKIIYEWGTVFYARDDSFQSKRILTGVKVTENGLLYCLTCNGVEDEYYSCEISENPDDTMNTNITLKDDEDE